MLRGKSIEEASRETRIRPEFLKALERERFEALLGDVYVRGFLRSYSTYLGLDADKVLTVFNRHFGPPAPTLGPPPPAPVRSPRSAHPHLPSAVRHHPSWAFLVGVALLALAVFAAAGLLRLGRGSPGGEGSSGASIPVLPPSVTVAVTALKPVHLTVWVNGQRVFDRIMRKNEARSWDGSNSIKIQLERGRTAKVTVNGHSLGKPGVPSSTYVATFTPESFHPSPSGRSPSGSPRASSRAPSATPSP